MPKKALIIAYYWPPSANVATMRWLHMSNALVKLGVDVTVVVPKNADYPYSNADLKQKISPETKVIQLPIFEARKVFSKFVNKKSTNADKVFFKADKEKSWKEKLGLWIRANLFIPDARVTWYTFRKRAVEKLVRQNNYDWCITTGTPHSVHLFGRRIKRLFPEIKWMADFRDPWTGIEYHNLLPLTKSSSKKHLRLEKAILEEADIVTTVSPSWANDFKTIAPKSRVEVVYNGYGEIDFEGINRTPPNDLKLVHLGTLNNDRNPHTLWEALSRMESTEGITIDIYGEVGDEIESTIQKLNLGQIVNLCPRVSHKEALQAMANAAYNLVIINSHSTNAQGRIPAKIFEYARSGSPMILLGDNDGDAAKIVLDYKMGFVFDNNQSDALARFLSEESASHKHVDYKPEASASEFDRFNQASKIFRLLQSL